MESDLIHAFMNETKCDSETAFEYLQANIWDVELALESWRHLNEENQDIFEKNEVKKLSRGISRATDNVNLVSRARREFAQKFTRDFFPKINWFMMDTPDFSFSLPDLNVFSHEFRKFLEKDLIENSSLVSLENSGRLNWWVDVGNSHGPLQRLWPLSTTGDGNCLLHAASLAIWGFHDRLLSLRQALHNFLETSKLVSALYRRWRWQQTKLNEQSGFVCSESEWMKEWQNIIAMASVAPRKTSNTTNDHVDGVSTPPTAGNTYESLEEIHVLVLAHVLRRPIIVIADTMLRDMNNEPFAPISFGGIYLPMEFQPKDCHRSPLLLTYDMAHFSALVAMETTHKENSDKTFTAIPLVDSDGVLLPVQFCVDPGSTYNWAAKHDQAFINSLLPTEKDQIALLKKYLDVIDLTENDAVSPEIDSEDEIEKRFIEVTDLSDGENTLFSSKNRAAKQLQSVARQVGSIGKSMSKKLKKNFGSITKVAVKPKKNDNRRMLCAEMHHKRHAYQDEMIKNYIIYARKRFVHENRHRLNDDETNPETIKLQEQAVIEGAYKCINSSCDSYGTVLTSYMCEKCYETQKQEELLNINSDSRFGTGRSKFYRDSDIESYDAIKNIPVAKCNLNPNRTLYLSKSTFYYDNNEPVDEIVDQSPNVKRKLNSKVPLDSSSNDIDCKNDNNANTSKTEIPVIRHISKFDFGNINENVNRNFIDVNNSSFNENHSTEPTSEYSKFDTNLSTVVQQCKNEAFNLVSRDGRNHRHIGSVVFPVHDINKNGNMQNSEKMSDIEVNLSRLTTNDVSFSRPKNLETHLNVTYCSELQRCKSNNCTNVASVHTDFYCTDCSKKRMTGITL